MLLEAQKFLFFDHRVTAGRGIAHSERIPDDFKGRSHTLHGLQLWAALPRALEEALPSFTHTPAICPCRNAEAD